MSTVINKALITFLIVAALVAAVPADYNWRMESTPFTVNERGEQIPFEEQSYGDAEADAHYRANIHEPDIRREFFLYPGNQEIRREIADEYPLIGYNARPPSLGHQGQPLALGPPPPQYGRGQVVRGPDPPQNARLQRPPFPGGQDVYRQGNAGQGGNPNARRLPPHVEAQMKRQHDRQ